MALRHVTRYLLLAAILLVGILLFSSSSPSVVSVVDHVRDPVAYVGSLKDTLPDFRFTFHNSAHKPPVQKNSTDGDSSWYSDWTWLNPFSSSVTLDQDRIVLPPQADRPPIYVFYDTTLKRDAETKKVDQELLLTWRRAWWAQGFRPVILTESDAMGHPLYQTLHSKDMPPPLEQEFRQWLAWGHMGTGLLASPFCYPMAAYHDPLLSHLRRGQYAQLTRFEGLGPGLYAGENTQINDAIKAALDNVKLNSFKTVYEAIPPSQFQIEQPTSIAFYDSHTITKKYHILAQQLVKEPNTGRRSLNNLIIGHLHTIWQNTFKTGIAVLQPLAAHTFTLVKPSKDLANLLLQCPPSLLQSSCPPNQPKCSPCVGSKMTVTVAPSFRNTSSLFTIAIVPHPYTMVTLTNQTDSISVGHIRRHTPRDPWITAVTRDILGDARGGPSRVVSLKDAVASDYGRSRTLWFTTEHFPEAFWPPPPPPKSPSNDPHPNQERIAPFPDEWLEELDWHFGFPIPRTSLSHGESLPPVPGPERWKAPAGVPQERKKSSDPDPPSDEQRTIETNLLRKARATLDSKDEHVRTIRAVAEAWNLADTEAWKFVKSYRARQIVERMQFEEEESSYSLGGSRGNTRWWRQ
ncbi:hypothetical protein B0A52_00034 [Exophiala mesophila]|uniref:Uncharacterized protein n=1 Tax=Exophiala mesophila TaxID=212818 RepID=A0A438NIX2_EXOME|nr:hypothetical protein B0A52_00034 [Exophiala mesophila]